ncbi:MAG TPA: SAM-dependent chlorinase/fluorinase [Candidatus Krumholzibacteria bacterium]|nr:SAM-dependent chlorinase/fluorinase [Candidatus Krumholzibacteria bacterium]
MGRPIVLLTDYGSDEFYAGVTRAVLASSSPASAVVDLTHDVPAHDVSRASFLLARSFEYLPAGAVVVAIVDPGVGTARRCLVIEIGDRTLVGPDNGFASDLLAMHAAASFFAIDEAAAQLATGAVARGATFQGRDLFAPVAAAIARGCTPADFGPATDRVVMLRGIPSVSIDGGRVHALGRHIDRFGNLLSDLPRAVLERAFGPDLGRVRARVGNIDAGGLVRTYADGAAGTLIVLLDSWDVVEAAVNGGRACDLLGVARPQDARFELYAP